MCACFSLKTDVKVYALKSDFSCTVVDLMILSNELCTQNSFFEVLYKTLLVYLEYLIFEISVSCMNFEFRLFRYSLIFSLAGLGF